MFYIQDNTYYFFNNLLIKEIIKSFSHLDKVTKKVTNKNIGIDIKYVNTKRKLQSKLA